MCGNIVEKIKFLEANPQVKEEKRIKGREFVMNNFNLEKVGGMWSDFLNKFE